MGAVNAIHFPGGLLLRTALFLTLLTALLLPTLSLAGDWRVIPIRLDFDHQEKSGVIRLINNADTKLILQITAAEWTQDQEGADHYAETSDIIFFPKILTIPPKEERILRAGIKMPAVKVEKTYRIFIEEIPEPRAQEGSAVTVAIRFGLPVFLVPLQVQPLGEIRQARLVDGEFRAQVANPGNVHFQITDLSVRGIDGEGKEIFRHPLKAWYLLAGASRTYALSLQPEECARAEKLSFELASGQVNLVETLEVDRARCAQ